MPLAPPGAPIVPRPIPVPAPPAAQEESPALAPPVEIAVPAPSAPAPLPEFPLLFVDESSVAAGEAIQVSGWYLPKRTRFDISLDGERVLGSASTNADGQMTKSLAVPKNVKDGKYIVVATAGSQRVTAARRVVIHKPEAIARSVAAAEPPYEPAGWLNTGTLAMGGVGALFVVFVLALFVGSRRRA